MFLLPCLAQASTVEGTIQFSGVVPAPAELDMEADPSCAEFHGGQVFNPKIVLDENRRLKNVFVYIKEGVPVKNYPKPAEKIILDQQGCLFVPRVLGIQTGQSLEIVNSDATLHNVNAQAKNQKKFNVGLPVQGMKMSRTFNKEEVMVMMKCDVHPWMRAYVGVLEHPFFAVTDADGHFQIKDLPPGNYTLELWHEALGRQNREITVSGDALTVDFAYRDA